MIPNIKKCRPTNLSPFFQCKKHGLTEHVAEGSTFRCKKCRVEKVARYRKNLKPKLVKHFGGQCELCGYDKCERALGFHHVFPETKEFGLSMGGQTRGWDRALAEARKCILVCSNYHAEVEEGIVEVPQKLIDRVKKHTGLV